MNKLKKSVLNLLLKAFKLNDVSPNEHREFNLPIPNNISSFNSEHPFYELLENVNLIAVFLDIKGRVVYCNPYLLMLTGYKLEELIGSDWFELMLKEANPETKEVFLKGLKTGKIANHFENPILSKTGKQFDIFWNNTILRDTSGTITGTASIGENITERKLAEKREKENARNLSNILESVSDAFVSLDTNWCYTYMNKKAGELFGRNPQEIIGKHIWTEFPEGVGQVFYHTYYKAVETQEFQFLEEYYPPYGLWFENKIYPSKEGLSIFFQDITNRKQAEENIQTERDFSNALLDGLPGIFYFYDNDFKFLRWNKNFETVSGYTGDEIAAMSPLDFFSDSEKDLLKERIGEVFTKGYSKVEADFLAKDGSRTPYFFNGFKFSYNNKDCLIGIGIDITERIEAEKEVNGLIKNLQNLTDSVKKLSSARDLDSIVSIVKNSAKALAGADGVTFVLREDDLCYYFDEDAIEPLWKGKKFPIDNCVSGWTMLNNKPAIIEDIFDDSRVPAELYKTTFVKSLVMIPVNTYEPIGAIGHYWSYRHLPTDMEFQLLQTLADATGRAIENVTLYNELEKKVENRTLQLESANKELESFSYSISHDLRAPLRAIYGFSQILAERHRESLNEEGKQYMDYIVESSIRMEQLINDLLNYSKLGRKTVEIRLVSLRKIIDAIFDDFKQQIDEIGGEFKVADAPPVIAGDESLLLQIFSNLIGNAIKYRRTEEALSINISFETIQDRVLIKVADNGIGIPMEHCEKIFNVFQRLHSEDKYSGTGIGLANVKKAVTLLGGTIYVESKIGKGSTFVIEFSNKKPENHE